MIFTADWHLRDDVPRCRDQSQKDWLDFQISRVEEIVQITGSDDLIVVGDVFHRPTASHYLINSISDVLANTRVKFVWGNHDMRARDNDLTDTAYGTLVRQVQEAHPLVDWLPFGRFSRDDIVYSDPPSRALEILLVHQLVFESESLIPPGVAGATTPQALLKAFGHDLIVCGDNHTPFLYGKNRKVLNCGSITTQSVSENRPKFVWRVDEYTGDIKQIQLKNDLTEIVADRYTEEKKERDDRFDSFMELVGSTTGHGLSYEDTLLDAVNKPEVSESARVLIKATLWGVYGKT